jgi:hypothetical protein
VCILFCGSFLLLKKINKAQEKATANTTKLKRNTKVLIVVKNATREEISNDDLRYRLNVMFSR